MEITKKKRSAGYLTVVCYGCENAIKTIEKYLKLAV